MPGPESPDKVSPDDPKGPEKAKDADEAQGGDQDGDDGSGDDQGDGGGDGGDSGKDDDKDKEPPKTWVEFQLLDADGEPFKGEAVIISLPDGSTKNDKTGDKGIVRVEDIEKGDGAKVSIQLKDRYDYEWAFKEVKAGQDGNAG